MKKLVAILMLATAIVAPETAFAKDLSITAQMGPYSGRPAYLAIYVTKPDGSYDSTLWIAGQKTRFYQDLRNWFRGIAASGETIDGITGASVGSGQTLSVNVTLADALIDAGYQLHVDSAVEDGGYYPNDVVLPLSTASSGKPVSGSGYVQSLTVTM
ncbi:MAG: Tat pathway signal protein [Devosia sp.]|uniref:DUF2271 domain-containing protein n=1 Tax=Devosia sp. TaxID=1871048 RepID=UPI00262CB895|nr:DUF2271 domain-containing protein [Devosia sp.]MDB5529952.1 Tat pathway signal protein [Devosia sp.]